jgi:hypothetical protein
VESAFDAGTEAQIREWRSYLLRRRTIHRVDVDELEDHLRSEISELGAVGLSGDESFLVAIKRMGGVNDLSREFARERSSQLWKQLVLAGGSVRERSGAEYAGLLVTVGFAIAAAVAFKLPPCSALTRSARRPRRARVPRQMRRSTCGTHRCWPFRSSSASLRGGGVFRRA